MKGDFFMDRKIKFGRLLALAVSIVTIFSLMTISVAAFEPNPQPPITLEGATEAEQYENLIYSLLPSEIELTHDKADVSNLGSKLHYEVIAVPWSNNETGESGVNYTPVITLDRDASKNEEFTVENGATNELGYITFKEVAEINNRPVDVIINFDKINVGPTFQNFELPHDKIQVAIFHRNVLWVCGYELGYDNRYSWHGRQNTDITTKIVYSDTKEVVDYNFIYGQTDIDFVDSEGIQTLDGFTGKYYFYGNHEWVPSEVTENGEKQLLIMSNYNVGDGNMNNDLYSYTMGGVYLQTNNGQFKSRVITTHSGNAFRIFSQYKNNNPNPTKAIVPERKDSYKAGDTVTFDVDFTMFKWFDTFETYKSLCIYDELPDGIEYVSAKLLDGDGKDITATAGALTFDDDKNTVSYDFNGEWLANKNNYNGKDVTLQIETRVSGTAVGTIVNVGNAKIDGKAIPTNEVDIEVPTVPALSGRIWNDANKNGLQDADEASVSDIKVTLYDSADAVVGSMLTDENGGYKFSGLKADTYTVKADIDFAKYELTVKNAGDDTKDSDADKGNTTADINGIVIDDEDVEHMDIGIVEIPEETTPTLPPPPPETTVTTTTGGIVVTTIITGSTTPETTVTPVVTEETTPETTTPVIVTTEDANDTTAIVTSDDETTTAATTAEENPSTGNAPIAMASVAAALGAVMLLINRKKK